MHEGAGKALYGQSLEHPDTVGDHSENTSKPTEMLSVDVEVSPVCDVPQPHQYPLIIIPAA